MRLFSKMALVAALLSATSAQANNFSWANATAVIPLDLEQSYGTFGGISNVSAFTSATGAPLNASATSAVAGSILQAATRPGEISSTATSHAAFGASYLSARVSNSGGPGFYPNPYAVTGSTVYANGFIELIDRLTISSNSLAIGTPLTFGVTYSVWGSRSCTADIGYTCGGLQGNFNSGYYSGSVVGQTLNTNFDSGTEISYGSAGAFMMTDYFVIHSAVGTLDRLDDLISFRAEVDPFRPGTVNLSIDGYSIILTPITADVQITSLSGLRYDGASTDVPEPISAGLLGLGALVVAGIRRRSNLAGQPG